MRIAYLNVAIALGAITWAAMRALMPRDPLADPWLDREIGIPNRVVWLGGAALAAVLFWLLYNQFSALEVNAWDFSFYSDRPLGASPAGRLLWCERVGMPMLGVHCGYLLLAFVPLYLVHATPLWLLLGQSMAIASAAVVLFFVVRKMSGDDVVAGALALAFPLNAATARGVSYVFHLEIFYPLGIFLLAWALLARRPWVFVVALVLTLSIKEDAIIPLLGFAAVAWAKLGRRTWAAGTIVAALAAYAIDTRLVLPHLGGQGTNETMWYSWYWASFGRTPLLALGGMLRSPVEVASRFLRSGAPGVLLSMLFVPVIGWEWCLAAMPGLLVYGVSDYQALSQLSVYYALPLIPLLFLALPDGIARAAAWVQRISPSGSVRKSSRLLAMAVLAAAVFVGSPYKVREPRAERDDIGPALAALAPGTPVLLQGALMPHAGYGQGIHVLDRQAPLDGRAALLIAPTATPYPFSKAELDALVQGLARDPRYVRATTPHGLLLFRPRS
jgi:uncharacterized membrane protein